MTVPNPPKNDIQAARGLTQLPNAPTSRTPSNPEPIKYKCEHCPEGFKYYTNYYAHNLLWHRPAPTEGVEPVSEVDSNTELDKL